MVENRTADTKQNENHDVASYLNSLPINSRVLIDDAVAYPIVALVTNIKVLTMPYQEEFASALESPEKYADYILVTTDKNIASGYTQINDKYVAIVRRNHSGLNTRKIYATDNWALYEIIGK
jgi:hypothetical protein